MDFGNLTRPEHVAPHTCFRVQPHSQKFVTASGLHRGRIIKIAARANERVSSFYKDLNYVSNADLLKNRPAEIAKRAFSHRRMKKKRQIL